MTEEQKELFERDAFVKLVKEAEGTQTVTIIGGAVLDILRGVKPKDYDLTDTQESQVLKLGFEYQYSTTTADTYKKDDIVVQLLKTAQEDFDFKISTATFIIHYSKQMVLSVDEISFANKVLIPMSKSFTEKKNALNSLRRICHWRNKGYNIPDETYLSLLNVIGKSNNKSS